jgi:hypothetical protein
MDVDWKEEYERELQKVLWEDKNRLRGSVVM